jgi:hypothetical protein
MLALEPEAARVGPWQLIARGEGLEPSEISEIHVCENEAVCTIDCVTLSILTTEDRIASQIVSDAFILELSRLAMVNEAYSARRLYSLVFRRNLNNQTVYRLLNLIKVASPEVYREFFLLVGFRYTFGDRFDFLTA